MGTSLQFSVSCTYVNGSNDNCAAAGGVTWSSSQAPAMTVNSSGLATWNTDPGSENPFALGHVIVSAGGVSDNATIMGQHVGDVFYQYPTPDYTSYQDPDTGALLPLNVVVGSTVTIGSGFVMNQAVPGVRSGNPFQMTCNWLSSNTGVATVDKHGQVTAVAPGTVTITCGRAGTGVYGVAASGTWTAPGNVITLTVVSNPRSNATWYVRPGGGTPFVSASQTPNGQCDGLHDADYPGSGVNQPCAMGNLRYLYLDGVTHHQAHWMIRSGDTVIVRQKPAGYPVAYDAPYTPTNCDDSYCDLPTIPSGTATQHTRILGENYASCHSDSAKTLLTVYGREAINVKDSQFVDVSCFEITDKAACGPGAFTNASCPAGSPAGAFGILESALTSNVNYTDLFIHGLSVEAIHGATGVGVVGNYVHIRAMPMGGIDMDDAPWQSSNISVAGGFTLTNSITEFTGCIEEYPVVHNYPYIECRDQNTNGYGDGFGTGSTTGNWVFDHDIWRYNFQDGLDLLHSGMQSLTVTNSQSYGNDGQTYKIGAADSVIFRNNFAMDNCNRILFTFGDEPASAIVPGVSPCRGGGDWVPLNFTNQGTYLVQNNTFVGYGSVPFDLACAGGWNNCSQATTVYQNNVLLGYADPLYQAGQPPASFYIATAAMPPNNGWTTHDHNILYNVRNCPSTLFAGESCNTVDPKFINEPSSPMTTEAALDGFSYVPSAASPLLGAGTPIVNLVTDILGDLRPSRPSIGAIDLANASNSAVQQTTSVTLSVTPNSAAPGASVTISAATTSAGSALPTGTVTFFSGNTSLGATTLNSGGVATFTSSSLPAGAYNLTASYSGDSNFAPATSSPVGLTVAAPSSQQQAVLALSVTPNPATPGQAIALLASVTSSGAAVPTGNVIFNLSGKNAVLPLASGGVATMSIPSLPAGAYTISASYSGDSNYSPLSPSSFVITVAAASAQKQQPSVTLNATPTNSSAGQTVTFTVTTLAVNGLVPSGTVSFSVNGTTISSPISPTGVATASTSSLGVGTFAVAATYSGDSNFNSGSATPLSITVVPAQVVSVSIGQPAAGFNVIPGSVRRIFATVNNGATGQLNWVVKSGSAQISSSTGSWVDITAGNTGGRCQLSNSGSTVSSSSQFTIEATSVDDGSKKADVTFNVCNPSVEISTIPAYRTLYANQTADIQSLVVGSVNDEVQWAITSQPSGGDGKLADSTVRDTIFSATAPGRYILTATSTADPRQVATSILYVTGHNMPYRVTRNLTEPVDCSVDPALLGSTYDVGPSQIYHRLQDLPLGSILNGSTVRVHNEDTTGSNPTTFNEYIQLSEHAAPDQPIRVCGVPDARGNLPIIDATNATGRSDITPSAAGGGIITVGESTSGAAWPSFNGAQNIVVEGLHLRNARAGVPYITPAGTSATWQSSAACIRVGDGHNISLIGDEMDSCANGAASLWNGTTWGGSSLNHLWEGNHIHGSGTAGSSANHQMYLQGWGEVVQFNRIDQIASGAAGANLKSRGIQDVIRYNYFGDGAARDMDLVDVQGAAQFMSFGDFFANNASPTNSTYSMDQLAAWQEAWNSHFAYGNIYLNSTSTAPIHFAYDQSGAEPARKGNLYWYNNTFYETLCSSCSGQLLTMFDTSGSNGSYLPQAEFQTVKALDNIIWMDSTTQPVFQWNNFDAFIGIGAANILPAGWGADTLKGGSGDGWNATLNTAAYQNAGNLSLHITGFSGSNVETSSAIPFDKISWILANPSAGTTSLPSEACEMPTRFTYLPTLGYAVPRTSAPNIGATDTAAETAAIINIVGGGNRRLTPRPSTCQ